MNTIPSQKDSSTTPRTLVVDPHKCTGCRLCLIACSLSKEGVINPDRARIRILQDQAEGPHLPVGCRHCETAPCLKVCPREAVYRDTVLQRIVIDYERCISCRMCMAVCPFGAIGFNAQSGRIFKCDLCEGDPECVRFCFPGALTFMPDYRQQQPQIRTAARRSVSGKTIRESDDP
jgi:Fe-S-cluster-containing hydrogenase component 2